MKQVDNPAELATLLNQDRETHIYGLADLEEPYWSNSSWYRDDEAVVGAISDGSDWITAYAMSRSAPNKTLSLLEQLSDQFPPNTWATGPIGMTRQLRRSRDIRSVGTHLRMILEDDPAIADDPEAVSLGLEHEEAIRDLERSSPDPAFFLPSMVDQNPFVGLFEGEMLVAMAGTHVVSKRYGVAAVGGVQTRPSHRGRGLGRRVTSCICSRLIGTYETIGLNVMADNVAAISIYEGLGFRRAFEYEEIELL